MRWFAFLVVMLCLPLQLVAATPTLEQSLDDCIDSQFVEGEASRINETFEVVENCPELFYYLQNDPRLQSFQPPLESESSLNQLLDIRYLLKQRVNPDEAIYTAVDRSFLEKLGEDNRFEEKPLEQSLWERFIAWLKDRYQNDEEGETDWSWLIDFLESGSMPDWLGETIYYISVGIIIILALLIVANELRAANIGKWRKRRRKKVVGEGWADNLATIDTLDWSSIGKLPLQQQPGAILRFVIDDLIERGWLSNNRSRTNREMWRELKGSHRDDAMQFDRAIVIAERSVYGDEQLDSQQVEQLYQTAHAIVTDKDGKS